MNEQARAAADRVLMTTRAVPGSWISNGPCPTEVIEDCVRVALQAPIGGNIHSWRFVVVTDRALCSSLANIYRASSAVIGERAALLPDETTQTQRVYASAAHLVDNLDQVPLHVLPFVRPADFEGSPPALVLSDRRLEHC